MKNLLDIDRDNLCNRTEQLVPDGSIRWSMRIAPKSTIHLSSPISTFVDVVLLDYADKFKNLNHTYDNIGVQNINVILPINSIVVEQKQDIIFECVNMSKFCGQLLAAQYMLHCLRDCSFIDAKYKQYVVLNCSPGEVTGINIERVTETDITGYTQQFSYLFQSLFIKNNTIQYAGNVISQGLKKFVINYCFPISYNNFPEFFTVFNSSLVWYKPNLILQ